MWQLVRGEMEDGWLEREAWTRGLGVSLCAGSEKVAAIDC